MMMRKLRTFRDDLLRGISKPKYAIAYLTVALDVYDTDQDTEALITAVRDIVESNREKNDEKE